MIQIPLHWSLHISLHFGGPAYYFYKICSVIHLADQMNTFYPGYHFVPVFVSGSEDHDFDEVKSLHMYGKNIVWNTDQTGPVGRFKTSGLREVLDTISNILGTNENAEKYPKHLMKH